LGISPEANFSNSCENRPTGGVNENVLNLLELTNEIINPFEEASEFGSFFF